jgi:hypothetical protein
MITERETSQIAGRFLAKRLNGAISSLIIRSIGPNIRPLAAPIRNERRPIFLLADFSLAMARKAPTLVSATQAKRCDGTGTYPSFRRKAGIQANDFIVKSGDARRLNGIVRNRRMWSGTQPPGSRLSRLSI